MKYKLSIMSKTLLYVGHGEIQSYCMYREKLEVQFINVPSEIRLQKV